MSNAYGIYFPIEIEDGKPKDPTLVDSVDSSVRIILTWALNTRNFTPYFGCILYQLLGQPMSYSTIASLEVYITTALSRWEPRLNITSVEVEPDYANGVVTFTIKGTVTERTVSYDYEIRL